MSFYSKLSIGRKLGLVMGGALIISLVTTMLITNSLMRNATVERISESEIPAVLSSVANDLELQISKPLTYAKSMANNNFLLNWLNKGEPENNVESIADYLARVKQDTGAMFAFLVSADSNNYYNVKGVNRTVSRSNDADAWLYNFLDSDKAFSLDLDTDASKDIYTLFINYRMAQGNAVTGVGITVSELSNLIKQYKIGAHGFVYLVDETGQIRIHPNSELSGKTTLLQQAHTSDFTNALLNPNDVNVIEDTAKGDTILASRYIDSLGWYLIAEIPTDEVFQSIKETTRFVVISNIVVAALVLLVIMWMATSMAKPIQITANMLDAISKGDADLSKRLREDREDELGRLAKAFNRFMENMAQLVSRLASTSSSVSEVSEAVLQSANTTQNNSSEQLTSVEMVATAINQMGATVKEIAQNATLTADTSSESAQSADDSQSVVQNTVSEIQSLNSELEQASEVISALADDINKISSILAVISGISEQTNLLALNAAIEAARAGEQGRGFAVVADEVRMLAGRTHESTEEINQMISRLEKGAQDAVSAMQAGKDRCLSVVDGADRTNESLNSIRQAIQTISDMSFQVATATEQQSSVVEDLNQHIVLINEMAHRTQAASNENSEAAQSLEENAKALLAIVSNFKY